MAMTLRRLTLLLLMLVTCLVAMSSYLSSLAFAGGEWRVKTKTLTELKETEVSVTGSGSSFTLSVPWYELKITCSTLETKGVLVLGGDSQGTISLSGCKLTGPPFVSETCKLVQPIEIAAKGLLYLEEGYSYELFEAAEAGGPLGTIYFEEGTKCPLPLSNELKSVFSVSPTIGIIEEESRHFSFFNNSSEFGGHSATISGSYVLELSPPFEGQVWTGIAGPPSEEELTDEWTIRGSTLKNLELEEYVALLGSLIESPLLTVSLPSIKYVLQCQASALENPRIWAEGWLNVTLLLTSCKATVSGVPTCGPGVVKGNLTGGLVLHNGKTYILFGGKTSSVFEWTIGEECFLFPGKNQVVGSFASECTCETEKTTHTLKFNAATRSLFSGDGLKYGTATTVTFDGSFSLDLASPNSGFAWGGIG
jgi:hypothetical protein